MRKLNTLLLLLSLICFLGCGFVQLKSEQEEVIVGVAASSLGYYIGKNNPDKVTEWIEWTDKLLAIEPGEECSTLTLETLLVEGFNYAVHDPYIELQFSKLIKLLEFPELQPPNLPFLSKEYLDHIKVIINDFRDGLLAVSGE